MGFKPSIPEHYQRAYAIPWLASRGLEFIALLILIGFAANFVNTMDSPQSTHSPPPQVWTTLILAVVGAIWCFISLLVFLASHCNGLLVLFVADTIICTGFVIFTAILADPIATTSCMDAANASKLTAAANFASETGTMTFKGFGINATRAALKQLMLSAKGYCNDAKYVWVMSILSAILFLCTGAISFCMWCKAKQLKKDIKTYQGP